MTGNEVVLPNTTMLMAYSAVTLECLYCTEPGVPRMLLLFKVLLVLRDLLQEG